VVFVHRCETGLEQLRQRRHVTLTVRTCLPSFQRSTVPYPDTAQSDLRQHAFGPRDDIGTGR
jgi:hypothetical protein